MTGRYLSVRVDIPNPKSDGRTRMLNNILRSAGLGGALLALAVLVGCATTEEAPPAPPPAPAPAPAAPAPAPAAAPAPAPAPMAAPAPKPAPKPMAQKVTLAADVLFDFDKSVIKPVYKDGLDNVSAQIRGINLEVVIAIGHADLIGTLQYNQKLSVRRAEATKAYLVSKGIEPNRIYTEGKGETQPVKACPGVSGKALIACLSPNRRVELEVIGTKK
jgi:OmpA-OmpF porin, OOP family